MGLLEGKVIIVTGAGRGIGRDIALMAAAEGARIIVNDLGATASGEGADKTLAMETVAAIRDAGGDAVLNGDSVGSWDAAHRMVELALDTWGRLDGIVNNAGILRDVIFHKMTEEDWDQVVLVHLKGSFNTSRAAATHFRENERGAYVHMTSTSGLIGNFGQANYSAAKLGVIGLSKSIALDMQRYKVRSNCIAPFAWSRMTGSIPIADEAQAKRVERFRQMVPAKIAPLAAFLLSDAAREVTGQIFAVRHNEIFLFNQNRPIRSVQRSEGWTPQTVAEHAMPALKASFTPLDRSADIFSWDPV